MPKPSAKKQQEIRNYVSGGFHAIVDPLQPVIDTVVEYGSYLPVGSPATGITWLKPQKLPKRLFHGTRFSMGTFNKFGVPMQQAPELDQPAIAIGTHMAADPTISAQFASGINKGAMFSVDPKFKKVVAIAQPPGAGDDASVAAFVARTVFKKRPDLFMRIAPRSWETGLSGIPDYIGSMSRGTKYDDIRRQSNFLYDVAVNDRPIYKEILTEFTDEMKRKGVNALRYVNTLEGGAVDQFSYIHLTPEEVVGKFGPLEGIPKTIVTKVTKDIESLRGMHPDDLDTLVKLGNKPLP